MDTQVCTYPRARLHFGPIEMGCGSMGLMDIVMAKAMGARAIAGDIDQEPLAEAQSMGAGIVLNPVQCDMLEKVEETLAMNRSKMPGLSGIIHN